MMQEQWGADLETVIRVVGTALTPAFLLVAVGSMLNVLTGRLSRIVDRSRDLSERHGEASGDELVRLVLELRLTNRRMRIVSQSILLAVLTAIAVCVMIALLFLMGLTPFSVPVLIVAVFIIALILLSGSLLLFVREVQLATRAISVAEQYLTLPED